MNFKEMDCGFVDLKPGFNWNWI